MIIKIFHRLTNLILLLLSFSLSRIFGRVILFGKPLSISIEPTTFCNLRCPECPSGLKKFSRPTGYIDEDLFKRIVEQLNQNLFSVILYFQGEPSLHPNLFDFIKHTNSYNIYTIISTNGNIINDDKAKETVESKLNKIIISIDGTTQEVYSSYRIGGALDNVVEGTKNLVKWKNTLKSNKPEIHFQFLVTSKNEFQIDGIRILGKQLGVDNIQYKTAQLYNYEHGNELMPKDEKYSRYKKGNDGKYHIKNKLSNSCWRMWSSCVITWDGLVVPCCFDKDAKYVMGDLNKESFDKIWNNQKYIDFRKSVLKNRKGIDICKNCTEGTKVWL